MEGSGGCERRRRRRRWTEMWAAAALAATVPPRAAGAVGYKAVASWRFQPGFVRRKVNEGGAGRPAGTDAQFCGSGAPLSRDKSGGVGDGQRQSTRCTPNASVQNPDANSVENGARLGSKNVCDLGKSGSCGVEEASPLKDTDKSAGAGAAVRAGENYNPGRANSNGSVKDADMQDFGGTSGRSNAGDGAACDHEDLKSNIGVNYSSEGMDKAVNGTGQKSNDSSRFEDPEENSAGHTGKGCTMPDEAADAKDAGAKGCRKGWKAVVPWRFQVGYKRAFSTAFSSHNGSPDLPAYRVADRSTQCTPASRSTVRCYASGHSGVRVSAMRDFSVKSERETDTAYNKRRKTNNDKGDKVLSNNGGDIRESIMRLLQDFRLIYRELLDEQEDNTSEAVLNVRADLQAYRMFREKFSTECDDKNYVGSVPGIHVGDIFHLRVELCVVGLHRPHRVDVDCIKKDDGTCVAVSIVYYIQSSEVNDDLDVLVYSGPGAVTVNEKINGTNLALKKSMDTNTPVRVIHGFSTHLYGNCRKKFPTYVYGGLYLVEKYWREKEQADRYVYMFRLRRMEGQKHIDIKEIVQASKAESHDSIIIKDLSHGLERIPIPVVNSISDERPMHYHYMSRLKYSHSYKPTPAAGCGCVGGCSDSKKCACAMKNGGEIPFNDKGRIIVAKPLVYECGPSCKCPPTCHNRVGQHGIKFRLQVFKTKSMGWGVRTLDFIPSGSFVCEYVGEVLEDEEAQKRTSDVYLFAIGHNYYDESLWEGLPRSIPALQNGPDKSDEAGFAVDASEMGNFAKFINHSCTPNLYAQNVLYDHDDKSMPHIMFFASDDIRPGQELAYHYNYKIDQVHDANGNIKKKKCLCGSVECDGWLY